MSELIQLERIINILKNAKVDMQNSLNTPKSVFIRHTANAIYLVTKLGLETDNDEIKDLCLLLYVLIRDGNFGTALTNAGKFELKLFQETYEENVLGK
jgi:hypothetical protein